MPYRVRHPEHGYYASTSSHGRPRWTNVLHEARAFCDRRTASVCCSRNQGTLVEPHNPDPMPDWRSIAVPFEPDGPEALIGVPCAGFGAVEDE